MGMWSSKQRAFVESVSAFSFLNPFWSSQMRRRLQVAVKRAASLPTSAAKKPKGEGIALVLESASSLLSEIGKRPAQTKRLSDEDFRLYQDLVLFVLYYSFRNQFQETIERALNSQGDDAQSAQTIDYYDDFARQWRSYWDGAKIGRTSSYSCQHVFACLFLIRRAYFHIHEYIWGDSPVVQNLRAKIWESIFTHDFRRFGLLLYERMEDITTLISGPSGTGKELVARAIGMSRYIPFDTKKKQFKEEFGGAFHPVNIAALSPTIVESELFGHAKGAFTDALQSRPGWFELCKPGHTVFLDEIGELSPTLQVKLLRVVQNREFQRLGETRLRKFGGKLIVATNRDFSEELSQGRFREDLYYRLCSDVVTTPSLRDQIHADPGQLKSLATRIAMNQLGDSQAASAVADDAMQWIEGHLGSDYPWPGNFRELEQCVLNVLIRKSYQPVRQATAIKEDPTLAAIRLGKATADEVISRYCRSVYSKTGSYAATARIVGLDQRTVKRRIEKQNS